MEQCALPKARARLTLPHEIHTKVGEKATGARSMVGIGALTTKAEDRGSGGNHHQC